jgi:hypothetical protein
MQIDTTFSLASWKRRLVAAAFLYVFILGDLDAWRDAHSPLFQDEIGGYLGLVAFTLGSMLWTLLLVTGVDTPMIPPLLDWATYRSLASRVRSKYSLASKPTHQGPHEQ